jgi:tetratricopeptide (TPR) repeat protein
VAHLNAQRFEDALKYLQPALALTRELKDKPAEAWVLNNIGMVLAGLNRHAEGLQALEQALVVAREARIGPAKPRRFPTSAGPTSFPGPMTRSSTCSRR